MNDVLDIMNGRSIAQGINIRNWGKKKEKLDIFLNIVNITEECNRARIKDDPNIPLNMFLSDTTFNT